MDQKIINVLLVEDNPGDVWLVKTLLAEASMNGADHTFSLTHVEQLSQALTVLTTQNFEVILLDLSLPDSQGLDTIYRTLEATPALPVLVMSGLNDASMALEVVKAGAQDYLVKGYVNKYTLPCAIVYAIERQRSEAFTRAILGSLKAHIAVLNQAGTIMAVNQAWEQFAAENGDPTHHQTGVGTNYLEVCRRVVGEEAAMTQAVVAGIQAVSANLQEQFSLEYPCHSPSEQRWFMMRVTPLRDGRGSVVVAHEEITGRVQAEQETRRRNRELTLLNQIIAASAGGMEPESMLETACRELALFFEAPQAIALLLDEEKTEAVAVAEWLPQGWPSDLSRRFAVKDDPALTYLLSHAGPLAADDAQRDPRLVRHQALLQQHRVGSLLALPLMVDGKVMGGLNLSDYQPRHFSPAEINLAWSVADQVAGALARSRLTQLHHRLNAAIEQAAEVVVITEVDGKIIYVNPAFEKVSGYSRAEVIGQYPRLLKSGKQNAAFYQELWATLRAGRIWQGRFVNKKKDGALYTEEATISPIKDEAGQLINFVAVKRDITRELQLEQQYHQAQKMEAIGRLTGGIAHDFNNLLTAINGFAELLQVRYSLDDSRKEMVDMILRSGQRAAALIRQLLVFSHQQVINPEVLNLNGIITELNKMLGRIIGEDIRMELHLASDLWSIKADPTQIEQVIVNLAVNARDAMPHGGQLTIETANVILDGDYTATHLNAQPGEYVLLAVSDTGTGMSEAVKAHIFEPFFTTKGAGQGTGLGLATVYGIVEQSGGAIWVYSEERQGTTFKIYLPRAGEAAAQKDRSEADREAPTGHETILVVEDGEAVRALAQETLETQGYTVLVAADGEEALQVAAAYPGPIQLLLTDLIMPYLNGRLLAEELSQVYPDLKILFMSGYTDNTLDRTGLNQDKVNFLQKPFSPIILAQRVRQILDANK
ncbi:MAG: response regulator [Anaerolineae bacterium]|nr:response regulator [Anaerolineae bacterium]